MRFFLIGEARKNPQCICMASVNNLLQRNPTQSCYLLCSMYNIHGLVSFASMWFWRQKWGICLNEKPIQRNIAHHFLHLLCISKGHNPRNGYIPSLRNNLCRFAFVSTKTMKKNSCSIEGLPFFEKREGQDQSDIEREMEKLKLEISSLGDEFEVR